VDDDVWALIEPLRPPWPTRSPGPRPVGDRLCLQDVLYVLHQDVAWQLLPLELGFGSGQTCWRRLDRWQRAGAFVVFAAARVSARACIGESPVRGTTHLPTHRTVRHFPQANPADRGCESVPAVLRRLDSELTEHGPWRSEIFDFRLPEDEH
jgi:hypothetical protein